MAVKVKWANNNIPDKLKEIYERMPYLNVATWTSLQNLYHSRKMPVKSLRVFSYLVLSNFEKSDSHSIVAALSACAHTKDITNGRIIHGMTYKYHQQSCLNVNNALIDMYGKSARPDMARRVFSSIEFKDVAIWTSLLNGYLLNGDTETAEQVFEKMPQRNIVSWTTMIVGYVRRQKPVEALELFKRMKHEDAGRYCSPTTFTVVALLSGCADIGALNLGSSIHGYINKRIAFVSDVAVNNGLIDMYAKSGNLDSAVMLFDRMTIKDLFSWTTMISGLALNGRGKHALLVFDSMVELKIAPNEVTFLAILSACTHSGLVIEGERLFDKFIYTYHMKPQIEHFGCLVDLFVRAGCLEKTIQLIKTMPMKPDAVIWRSLLGACLGYRNLELAEVVGKKILELEPSDDATYVILWRIYCSKNRWDDALRTVKAMRDQRIKKTPGCSWIEVNGIVYEFLVEAFPQHSSDSMIIVLNGIHKTLKLDTNVLHFEWTCDNEG